MARKANKSNGTAGAAGAVGGGGGSGGGGGGGPAAPAAKPNAKGKGKAKAKGKGKKAKGKGNLEVADEWENKKDVNRMVTAYTDPARTPKGLNEVETRNLIGAIAAVGRRTTMHGDTKQRLFQGATARTMEASGERIVIQGSRISGYSHVEKGRVGNERKATKESDLDTGIVVGAATFAAIWEETRQAVQNGRITKVRVEADKVGPFERVHRKQLSFLRGLPFRFKRIPVNYFVYSNLEACLHGSDDTPGGKPSLVTFHSPDLTKKDGRKLTNRFGRVCAGNPDYVANDGGVTSTRGGADADVFYGLQAGKYDDKLDPNASDDQALLYNSLLPRQGAPTNETKGSRRA